MELNKCYARTNKKRRCKHDARDTCPGTGKSFCYTHRFCIQPASVTAYRLFNETYARIKSKLLRKGIPGSVIISIMKWAGEPMTGWWRRAEWKWLCEYINRVRDDELDQKLGEVLIPPALK
jgi:hypothetical protein